MGWKNFRMAKNQKPGGWVWVFLRRRIHFQKNFHLRTQREVEGISKYNWAKFWLGWQNTMFLSRVKLTSNINSSKHFKGKGGVKVQFWTKFTAGMSKSMFLNLLNSVLTVTPKGCVDRELKLNYLTCMLIFKFRSKFCPLACPPWTLLKK